MKFLKTTAAAALASATVLGLSVAAPTATQAQVDGVASIPVDVWALRSVVNAVQVSPDGKHILVHKTPTSDGEYLLEIYKADDLRARPTRLNAKPMEIISASWVSDDYIFGTAWQLKRSKVRGPEQDAREYLTYAYSLKTGKFVSVPENFGIVSTLPNDPDHVLIASGNAVGDGLGVDLIARFRPRSYYKFNLRKGTRSLIIKGNSKFPSVDAFDNEGNPRYTTVIDRADGKL